MAGGGGGGVGGAGGVGGTGAAGGAAAASGGGSVHMTGRALGQHGHHTKLCGADGAAMALLLLGIIDRNIQHALHSQPPGVSVSA